MSEIFNWFINLEIHEIVLWVIILLLLIWEFVIQKKLRKPLERELGDLRKEFMKLGFTAELSKKEIGELYKRFDMTEKELRSLKTKTAEKSQQTAQPPVSSVEQSSAPSPVIPQNKPFQEPQPAPKPQPQPQPQYQPQPQPFDQPRTSPSEPAVEEKLAFKDDHLFVLKLLGNTEEKRALANFVLAYYLNVFKSKNKDHYREVLSELLDNEMIDFTEDKGKTYMKITSKGLDYIKSAMPG
ncbi:MAG: hypothetical protein JXB26_20215 [Candidatus Aminicenantes bacterium]|nr:hypothetical protein [Candidatus Aminicenantes bacterium]